MTNRPAEPLPWIREVAHKLWRRGLCIDEDTVARAIAKDAPASPVRYPALQNWQQWRGRLQKAWAEDSRSLMTALLEDGPAASPVPESAWIKVENFPDAKTYKWVLVTDGELFDVALVVKGMLLGHREVKATHWQPLPAPPAEKGKTA